jgi:hypothetical protein
MEACNRNRRRLCLAAVGGSAVLIVAPAFAEAAADGAFAPPSGPVLLTLSGRVGTRNSGDGIALDLAQLEALPVRSFATHTPWYPQPRTFTGVLLRDLLAAVGAAGAAAHAVALNDYRATIPAEEIRDEDVMVAYRLDGQTMTVRERGPLVIIYPFDAKPALRDAVHYSRAVWQLHHLELR